MSTGSSPFDTGPLGGGDMPTPAAAVGVRDWLVLVALKDALDATGAFDAVALSEEPEVHGRSAAETNLAVLSLLDWQEVDESDDPEDVQDTVRMRFALTLIVRRGEAAVRDGELDRLLGVAKNAINGKPLRDYQTIPGWTKLRGGRWADPKPPERRMTVIGETAYYVDGDDRHDTEE
jgi:hypothetical protein